MSNEPKGDDERRTFRADLFAGRTVLVSGGSSGIGLAVARGFAAHGASVLATGTNEAKLAQARSEEGGDGRLRFDRLDVRDAAAIERTVAALDRLDILVNAQGVARPDDEFSPDVFRDVLDVNLTSAMRLSEAARPKLAPVRGSIINFGSMLSYLADASVPAYCASKTGLLGLTRSLAHAYGPEGIRVNAISPGYHRTDMTKPLWSSPPSFAAIERHAALRRWGTVDDLVGAALFLASPAASFVTGADLPVDGGYVVGAVTG